MAVGSNEIDQVQGLDQGAVQGEDRDFAGQKAQNAPDQGPGQGEDQGAAQGGSRNLRLMEHHERNHSLPVERLLGPGDVADYLGIPVKTLYQWRYKGAGPRAVRVGRHLRYRLEDVDGWLRAGGDHGRGEVA